MLPLVAAGLISAGTGIATSLIGGNMAGKARDKQMGLYDDQIADLTAWRDLKVNRDFFETSAGRDFLNRALKQSEGASRTIASNAAITGESAESQIAKQGNVQSSLAEAMSKIAAMGDLRNDQTDNTYQRMLSGLMGQKAGIYAGQAETGGNLVSAGGDLIASSAPGLAELFSKQPTPGVNMIDSTGKFVQGLAPMFAGRGTN